ncbi:MAG: glycosyltransferase family 2 protein [Bacteroidota bacterium]
MPAKNASNYLTTCLDSIVQQGERHWELLAVDDASTDETWNILQAYAAKDERIRLFRNTEKGIIPALRLAFQNSKGTYITRMDADDKMAKDKLKSLKAALQQKGKGYLATGMVEYFSDDTLGQGYQKYAAWLNELCVHNEHFNEVYKECVIPSPCWMLARTDFIQCGAFSSNRYPEDYDLCFRFYAAQLKPLGVPKILHHWRDHPNRTSRNDERYADNRFLDLKLHYFCQLDHDSSKQLVLWGAGKKGKTIAQHLGKQQIDFRWVCNQSSKWGHRIQGILMEDYTVLQQIQQVQIIIAVANSTAQKEIKTFLLDCEIGAADFFFFC